MILKARWEKVRRHLPRAAGGVLDAGFASLGNFFVGLLAIHGLNAAALGTYSLVFAAFLTGAVVARAVHFTPTESIAPAVWDTPLGVWGRSSVAALPTLIAGSALAIGLAILSPGSLSRNGLLFLAALAVISPVQDHGRQLLHLSERSSVAATSSIVFAFTSGTLVAINWGGRLGIDRLLIILLVSNGLALLPVVLAGLRLQFKPTESLSRLALSRGPWLLGAAILPVAVTYVSRYVVAEYGSLSDAGYAEAARTLAAPILVLHAGVLSAFRRELLLEGRFRTRRLWQYSVQGLAAAFAVIWWLALMLGPISVMVRSEAGSAYILPGLISLTVLANLIVANASTVEAVFLGASRDRAILGTQVIATLGKLLVIVPFTVWFGAYALPGSTALTNAARVALLRRADGPRDSARHSGTDGISAR